VFAAWATCACSTSLRHVGSELLKSRGFTDAQTRDDMLGGAAPVAREDGPDRSKADFTWCMFAAQRGHSVKNIAARLLEVSAEAQENARWHDEGYALVTAENAAAAAERGHKQGRG